MKIDSNRVGMGGSLNAGVARHQIEKGKNLIEFPQIKMEINYFPKRKQIQTGEQSFAINPTVIPINGWCRDGDGGSLEHEKVQQEKFLDSLHASRQWWSAVARCESVESKDKLGVRSFTCPPPFVVGLTLTDNSQPRKPQESRSNKLFATLHTRW